MIIIMINLIASKKKNEEKRIVIKKLQLLNRKLYVWANV